MKVKIDIDSATFIRFFAVLAGFVLLAYMIRHLATPLSIIFVSFFLAIALTPPVNKIASLIPGHSRIWATALAYVIVLAILGGLVIVLVPPAIKQSVAFVQQVPNYIDVLQDKQGPLNNFLEEYGLEGQLQTAVDNAKDRATEFARTIGSAFVTGVSSIFNGVITLLTVLVLTFLMLIEGPRWMQRLWSVYVDEERRDRHQILADKMYRVITAYVNGQLLIAFIAAAAALITLLLLTTLFKVPFGVVLPLSAVVLVTTMIPMVGGTLGGLIVTIALLFNDMTAAIIFALYYIVYQQLENNLVQPIVQSKSVELSALGVIIAVILGVSLAGLLGALLAIPIAGVIRILVNDFLEQRRKQSDRHPENMFSRVKNAISGADKTNEKA